MKVLIHPAASDHIERLMKRLAGTFLLHGPAGVGKRTTALEIARQVNCLGCKDESCRSCKMAASGNHAGIVTVSPDEKGKIGIGQIHELQHELTYQKYENEGQRVVIINEAHTLTLPAQNALLKTLEEPPSDTAVILTADTPSALLPTVISRCTMVYLPPVTEQEVERHIVQNYPQARAQAPKIAAMSNGAVGRAIKYAQESNLVTADGELQEKVTQLLSSEYLFERLQTAAAMASKADLRESYLRELTVQARKSARIASDKGGAALSAVERLHARLKANVSPKTAFEALAVELA